MPLTRINNNYIIQLISHTIPYFPYAQGTHIHTYMYTMGRSRERHGGTCLQPCDFDYDIRDFYAHAHLSSSL